MKREILIELDEDRVSVNKDTPTRYAIHPELLRGYYENRLDSGHLKALGKSIFDTIFSTAKRRGFIENKGQDELIIRIKSDIPKVHDIPFELFNKDPEKPEELGYLLKDPAISLLREPGNDIIWELPKRPLKMLLILAQPLEKMQSAPIDPLREVEEIKDALGALLEDGFIELFIEERPSFRRLSERLRSESFDIVHYSGHGVKGGYLILEDNENPQRAAQQTPHEFAEIFHDRPPRLIYLDTCEGARSDSIFPSLAYILSRSLPHCAVVANTASISDRAAAQSVRCFYEKLNSEKFEDAIGHLRRNSSSEWYKTVLFALPGRRFFQKEAIKVSEKRGRVEYGLSRPDIGSTYVYRYRLVRKASDIIEQERALLLHGLGGTGKSTMAQYLCRFFGSYFDHIVFIDLKLEEIKGPEDVLQILEGPECFSIKEPSSNTKERIKRIASQGRSLLVLDNLEEIAQDEKGLLKREWRIFIDALVDNPNIFTVLTSRFVPYRDRRNCLIGEGATLDIREYEDADISLLRHHTKGENLERLSEMLPALKKEFGFHPLAISLALSRGYKKDSILKTLEDEELRGLLEYYTYYLSPHPLLRALCHLPVPLNREIVEDILPAQQWKLALDLGIAWEEEGLIRFYPILRHFVKLDEKARGMMIERLQGQGGPQAALNRLFLAPQEKKMECFLKAWRDGVDPSLIKELVDVDDLGKMARGIKEPEKKAMTLNNLGLLYSALGKLEEAEVCYKESHKIYGELSRRNPAFLPNLAGTLNNLGNLYSDLGKLEDAEVCYKESLEIRRKLSRRNAVFLPDLAMTLNNLGLLYSALGKLEEAEGSYKESHEIRRELSRRNAVFLPDLATTLNNLGNLYSDLGKLEDAEVCYKESHKIYGELSRRNPAFLPDLAMTLNNLGILYRALGKLEEAEGSYKESHEIRRELSRRNAVFLPDLATTLNNLGNLYSDLGKLEEAEGSYKECLEIRRELLRRNPAFLPNLAGTLNNLGNLYSDLGKLEEAEGSYKESHKIYVELSRRNPAFRRDLATTLNNLGILYRALGKLEEAEGSYKESHKIYVELSRRNPAFRRDLATTLNNLGNLYSNLGKLEDAEVCYKESLEIRRELTRRNPAFAPSEFETLINYAIFLAGLGKWQELSKLICRYFELSVLVKSEEMLEIMWLREKAPIPNQEELSKMLSCIDLPDCREKTRRLFERISRLSKEMGDGTEGGL